MDDIQLSTTKNDNISIMLIMAVSPYAIGAITHLINKSQMECFQQIGRWVFDIRSRRKLPLKESNKLDPSQYGQLFQRFWKRVEPAKSMNI